MDCLTIGQLVSHFRVTRATLNHALVTYGPEPACRIGAYRVWTSDQLARIERSLAISASKRTRPVAALESQHQGAAM
ncbi:MAG: hypothetical protein IH830_03850 [Planctomycetes bacterium]|nr:hypothetical protein [Planctomycetota bacterium]